jgi:hypothetical protein
MIDYTKFKEKPKCIECGETEIDDIIWNKYKNKRKTIGKDSCWIKPKIINNIKYYRKRCSKCFKDKFGREPKKFNTLSYDMIYLLDVPEDELKKGNKKRAVTIENMVEKYGLEEGTLRFNDYCDKQAESNTFEHFEESRGWTKEQYNDYNKSRAITLETMILKYGEEDGSKKYKDYCQRQSYTNKPEYFINKYGEEEGLNKYNNFLSTKKQFYSNDSITLFKDLTIKFLNDFPNLKKEDIYFAEYSKEFYLIDTLNNCSYYYDFTILGDINICIEHHGRDHLSHKKRQNDKIKKYLIEDNKIKLFEIWDNYTQNQINIIYEEIKEYIIWKNNMN